VADPAELADSDIGSGREDLAAADGALP
jgi:hypothetical protein